VTATRAVGATFRRSRRYVGTLEPWVAARIGTAARLRVRRHGAGQAGLDRQARPVVATLDCRNSSAVSRAVAMQARALEKNARRQSASGIGGVSGSLLSGGFVSQDEVEQKQAESDSKQAQLLALPGAGAGRESAMGDCVLRAPFDGEGGRSLRSIRARSCRAPALRSPPSSIAAPSGSPPTCPKMTSPTSRPASIVAVRVLATGKELAAKVAPARARSRSLDAHRAHRDRSAQTAIGSIPSTPPRSLSLGRRQRSLHRASRSAAASIRGEPCHPLRREGEVAHARSFQVLGSAKARSFSTHP